MKPRIIEEAVVFSDVILDSTHSMRYTDVHDVSGDGYSLVFR
jgi:hypothetical protein